MLTLHQFPISHYCEKIRWVLDYKKIEYETVNHLPGFHAKKMIALTGQHSVPVLVNGDKTFADSAKIINYLENQYPSLALTPTTPTEKQEAMEWERFADKEIGVHVRKICYHTLLKHPKLVVKFFTQDGPWYGPLLIRFIFPTLRKKMRHLMKINAESVKESKDRLELALKRVSARLENNSFLVGNQFSRADIAVASLLAPLCCPKRYGLDWPPELPQELQDYIDTHSDQLQWVDKLYHSHR